MFACVRGSWLIKEKADRMLDLSFGKKEVIRDFIKKQLS